MAAEVRKQKTSPFAAFPKDTGAMDSNFVKSSERILRVSVDGRTWLKFGSQIAHYGSLKFTRLPALRAKGVSEKILRSVMPLVSADGKGVLYCATNGWVVRIAKLQDETVNIVGDKLIAFEDSLEFDMFMVRSGISLTSGGLFGLKLSGTGYAAIAVQGDSMVLPVFPGNDLNTDPQATVAWSDGLVPSLTTDLTWRNLIGKGGGESFQMKFSGSGEVVIQPGEDTPKLKEKLKKLI